MVIQRLEGIRGILVALNLIQENVELDNDEPSAQLRLALQAYRNSAQKLECMVREGGEIKVPETFEDRLRLVGKRILWPFKRGTLSDMQKTLDRLQMDLNLVLQILRM